MFLASKPTPRRADHDLSDLSAVDYLQFLTCRCERFLCRIGVSWWPPKGLLTYRPTRPGGGRLPSVFLKNTNGLFWRWKAYYLPSFYFACARTTFSFHAIVRELHAQKKVSALGLFRGCSLWASVILCRSNPRKHAPRPRTCGLYGTPPTRQHELYIVPGTRSRNDLPSKI